MQSEDKDIEKLLCIKTTGRDDTRSDTYNYPYEPTDYCVLKRLAESGYLGRKNHLVDYGCGKGRVSFYLTYETGCTSTGIEYDERLYNRACKNSETYIKSSKVSFVHENAKEYNVPGDADRFYFFNPFSGEILVAVLGKIMESYYENPRKMYMFFYYPSDDYVGLLMTKSELEFVDEIDCSDMFEGGKELNRERILIFTL